jgi:trimeric autotransporter adhesin
MAISTEARNDLVRIVVGMFNGAPGSEILSQLTNAFEAGQTRVQIATNLAKTAEYQSLFPDNNTNAEVAAKIVNNIIGDLATAAVKADAVALLNAQLNAKPTTTSAQKAAARAEVTVWALDQLKNIPATDAGLGKVVQALANKTDVAVYYSVDAQQNPASVTAAQEVLENVDDTAASVTAAKEAVDGGSNPGETYFLKVTADNIVGGSGDDVINALPEKADGTVGTTLSAFDAIDGGNGNDTLNIYTVAGGNTALPTSATIKNVETINIYNGGATFQTKATEIEAGRFEGATAIWQNGASNNVTGLAATTTAGFGGHAVNATVTTTTGAASVNLAVDAVTKGSALTTNGSNTVNITGSLATGGDLSLTANGTATATTVNVNSAVAATVAIAGAAATTLNAAGSTGAITYTVGGTQVNATTGSGADNVTITSTNKVTVATGAGNDTVSVNAALATGSSINLGAGNDTLTGTGSFGANIVVDGGEGTDAISASLINAGNAANIKNFELLDLTAGFKTALDLDLLTGSTISDLVLTGTNGAATVNNVAAGLGLSVKGDNSAATTTINVKGAAAGTADAFTITFAGATTSPTGAAAKADVAIAGIEAVTVVSGGTGLMTNTLVLDAAAAKTLTITGDKALVINFDDLGTAGATTGVSAIDASAATGAVTINTTNVDAAAAGLTVTTGAGKDTITLAAKATVVAGAGDDTIVSSAAGGTFTGGAGKDTFDVALAVATGVTEATSVFVTITDLQADDKIDFGIGATFVSEAVVLGVGVNNLEQALTAAVAAGAADEVSWFQYGNNTYIVASTNNTFDAGDVVVKLTGLVDLSDATLDTNVLTMA